MQYGSRKQKDAYTAIHELGVFEDLAHYNPALCRTLPIGIDVADSDLDIIMEANDLRAFEEEVQSHYSNERDFSIKRTTIRGKDSVKANFFYGGFEFELFGQAEPVDKQYAYIHMKIEYELLQRQPALEDKVKSLKKRGIKTEPAFCQLLNIKGDPYEALIAYGKKKGIIPLKDVGSDRAG
ncbi:alpha/beta hydrolase [Halobacillus mangrovi]|uniref:Alpha/beta hydrolase n=2 Tax=Halobacillus mangrovi TaxID=402384 RepID=A0A1W6A140_9BACI|nr:alpha/beta hydrolase [Halobacillus mangrovi]